MSPRFDIFICHAGPDRADAAWLADACREAGLTVFVDADLDPGDLWDEVIPQALDRSDLVAVLITDRWRPDPQRSPDRPWYGPDEVARTIRRARTRGDVRIVPLLTGPDLDDAIPYGLERAVPLILSVGGWPAIAERLVALRDDAPPPPAPPPPDLDLPLPLIEALADHFPDLPDARALWVRAGGKGRSVESLRRPVDLWQRLWIRSRQGAAARPEALLEAALAELPHNQTFRLYLDALRSAPKIRTEFT